MKMRQLAVRSLRANPVRFIATMLAIIVGTAFLGGAMILRDTVATALEANITSQLAGVDAAVQGRGIVDPTSAERPTGSTPSGSVPPGSTPSGSVPGSVPTAGSPASTTPSAPPPGGERNNSGNGGGGVAGASTPGVNTNVPVSLLGAVERAEGVKDAAGVLTGYVNVLDDAGDPKVTNALGTLWTGPGELNPFQVARGEAPDAAGEIALDNTTAQTVGVDVGGKLRLGTTAGAQEATVVGIVAFGEAVRSNEVGDVLVNPDDGFAWLNAGDQSYSTIYVAAADGVGSDELVTSVQGAVGPTYSVVTGDELRQQTVGALSGFVDVIGYALIAFALLALFVSLFTIFNTFQITVTQRTREFALLRALGALGKQVTRSVLVESVLLALVSSLIGVVVGALLVIGLLKLVPEFGEIAPGLGLKITPMTVLLVLIAGLVVTVTSALVPAIRAARTKPIEALHAVTIDKSGVSKVRAVIALVMLALGIALLLGGALVKNYWLMAPAPFILFLGVLIGGPLLANGFTGVVGRMPGVSGRTPWWLGVSNVRRNPGRSALTAFALVIGVFLVSLVTAGGGALRDYAVRQMSQLSGPDFTIFAATSTGISDELVDKITGTAGVAEVGEAFVQVGTAPTIGSVGALDTAHLDAYGIKAESGSLSDLGTDGIAIPSYLVQAGGYKLGDTVELTFDNQQVQPFKVAALTEPNATALQTFISTEAASAADPALTPSMLAIKAQPGQNQNAEGNLTKLVATYGGVQLLPGNFIAQFIEGFFNALINSVNVLLSVAVVIALFGIVNTLVLSVSERTHEIGLLRAVGMTRRQLRSTLRMESVIVSVLGSFIGLGFGLFMAWCLTRPILSDENGATTGFSWPVDQIVVIVVLGVLLGVVASLLPAMRASRLNVIEAVRSD